MTLTEHQPPHAVLMASGGMDSTVLAYWLLAKNETFDVLFIDYGQHCADMELATLKRVLPDPIANRLRIAHISTILARSPSRLIKEVDLWNTPTNADQLTIPYRNLLLLTAGVAYAASIGATAMYSAFINSNHALEIDAGKTFLEGCAKLFAATGSVQLQMPFRDFSKAQVAEIGLEVGAPIASTFSCQAASLEHCGACPNCVDRIRAFKSVVEAAPSLEQAT